MMQLNDNKKVFIVPSCDVIYFDVEDILTTSDDWGAGDIELTSIEKP